MSDELKVKVKVEVDDSSSAKASFQKDVQKIADETKNNQPKITIGIDSKSAETQFKDTIHNISGETIEVKINAKVNTNAQDINKKIQEMVSKSEKYSDYYIGRTSNRQVSGSDDRLISLQLYNDEMKKAIALEYKYDGESGTIGFVSQNDITNTKQLLDLQEKLAKSTEKLKLKQYDIFNGFDTKLQKLDSSYLSGAKKIVDADKLDILNNKRAEITTALSAKTPDGIVSDKSISDIKKMISEYELLIKVKKEAQYAENKLAASTFDDSQSKALAGFERQAASLAKFKNISSEAKIEVSGIRKAIKAADDAVSLKHATDQFAVLKDKIKTAETQIKSYNNLLEVQNSGKMYVSDRSKSNPTENIKQQLLGQADVSKVSISGKNYFDGQKEQLKSFSATVTLTTGEVKKLNFELTNIGKRKAFVQTDNGTIKTVTDIKRNFKELMALQDEVNATSIGGKLEDGFIKSSAAIKSLRSDTTALNNELNIAKSGFEAQQRNINGLINGRDTSQLNSGEIKQLNEYILKMNEAIKLKGQLDSKVTTAKSVQSSNSGIHKDTMALKNLVAQMKDYQNINDRFQKDAGFNTRFNNILGQAESDDLNGNINNVAELTNKLKTLKNEIKGAGLEGQTFTSKLQAQMQKLGVYFSAAGLMMGAFSQVKNMIRDVIELDGAVTDLQIATGSTREETEKLLDTYSKLGKEISSSTSKVATSANDWLRQGKSIEITNKLIKDSIMLSKLGKIDTSEATTALTTMSKAYNVADQDMTSLVDALTAVDMVSNTTAGGLAKSFQETAVSARMAGIDINRMAGYLAVVSEVSGDAPESVGTFFKSFLSRMSSIKDGRMIDPDTGEDLSSIETVLDNIGVKLRNDQYQFRNFGNVLDEVAVKWKEMEAKGDTVGQAKIASALGLTRQQEKAKILFENYDTALKYADIAANSLGTAEAKFNDSYLKSVEAAQERFTAQFETLSRTVIDSGIITGTIDGGTGLLGALTAIIDKVKILPTLATVAAGAMSGLTNKGGYAPFTKIAV